MQNDLLFCKKDFNIWRHHPWQTIIFKAGNFYSYIKESEDGDIFVYYNKDAIDASKRGHRFYDGKLQLEHYDYRNEYFYTVKECRKLKIQKIQKI